MWYVLNTINCILGRGLTAMDAGAFTADQDRQLIAQFSARMIERYGANAFYEALCVVAMVEELGRTEMAALWRKTASEIARLLDRRPPQREAA